MTTCTALLLNSPSPGNRSDLRVIVPRIDIGSLCSSTDSRIVRIVPPALWRYQFRDLAHDLVTNFIQPAAALSSPSCCLEGAKGLADPHHHMCAALFAEAWKDVERTINAHGQDSCLCTASQESCARTRWAQNRRPGTTLRSDPTTPSWASTSSADCSPARAGPTTRPERRSSLLSRQRQACPCTRPVPR